MALPPRVLEISEVNLMELVELATLNKDEQRDEANNPKGLHAVVLFYKTEPPEVLVLKDQSFEEVPAGVDYEAVATTKLVRADHVGVVVYADANGNDPYWWWSNGMRFHSR